MENNKAKSVSNQSQATTYGLITAGRILEQFQVTLSPRLLGGQVKDNHAFFHKLMRLPAISLQYKITNSQCRDIQAYAQQKLISYLYSPEAGKKEEEPGHELRQTIENKRQALVATGKELTQWEEQQESMLETVYTGLNEKAEGWYKTVAKVTKEAVGILNGKEIPLGPDFEVQLQELLLTMGSTVRLKEATTKKLKLKTPYGIVEKSVLALLCAKDPEAIDKGTYRYVQSDLLKLDDKLRLLLDDLGGFNQENEQGLLNQQEQIQALTDRIQQAARDISKTMHNYYQRYGESSLHTDTADQALEQGVDPTVAADYVSLTSR